MRDGCRGAFVMPFPCLFFWASDYSHADHTASYRREVEELAGLLEEPARRQFLGENVRNLYGLR